MAQLWVCCICALLAHVLHLAEDRSGLQILRRHGMWYETYVQDTVRNLGGLQEADKLESAQCEDVSPHALQPHVCHACAGVPVQRAFCDRSCEVKLRIHVTTTMKPKGPTQSAVLSADAAPPALNLSGCAG